MGLEHDVQTQQECQEKAQSELKHAAEEIEGQIKLMQEEQMQQAQEAEKQLKQRHDESNTLINVQFEERKQASAEHQQVVAEIGTATENGRTQLDNGVQGVGDEVKQFCLAAMKTIEESKYDKGVGLTSITIPLVDGNQP